MGWRENALSVGAPLRQHTDAISLTQPGAARAAASTQSAGSSPSVLAAIGFSCVTLLVAGVGFAYSRRRRPRA